MPNRWTIDVHWTSDISSGQDFNQESKNNVIFMESFWILDWNARHLVALKLPIDTQTLGQILETLCVLNQTFGKILDPHLSLIVL